MRYIVLIMIIVSLIACEEKEEDDRLTPNQCERLCKDKRDAKKVKEAGFHDSHMIFWKHGVTGICFAGYLKPEKEVGGRLLGITQVPCFRMKHSMITSKVVSDQPTPEKEPDGGMR